MPVVTPEDLEELATAVSDPGWDYLAALQAALAASRQDIAAFRAALTEGDNRLKQRFLDDEPVERLVRDRARLVDALLKTAWALHVGEHVRELALIAVGGYGRGELNLCSDIDIMILLPKSETAPWQPNLERFLTFMWDIGLEVGHSVRTIDDCQRESAADVSVATTMIEARLLVGPGAAVRSDAARARARARLADARFLRSEGRRADGAPSPLSRHRLQPRAEREVEPRRAARHPDDRLGREAPLRRRLARRAGRARLPHEERAAQAEDRAGVPVEDPLRAARADQPPRGPAAVRSPDPAREDVRLRGRDLHARGRAVHAALLPHGDGREPAERNAAAAVPRGDPHRSERRADAGQSALPDPQRLSRDHERRRLRPLPVRAARAVRRDRAEPGDPRRARLDDPPADAPPVADRRGVPPASAQSSPVLRDPARARSA